MELADLDGAEQRIVVALDVPTAEEACGIASDLRAHVGVLKIGLELLMSAGVEVVKEMTPFGLPIFLDGKFHDIPTTVAHASRAVTRLGVSMFSVHALGGRAMMRSAAEAARDEAARVRVHAPLVLAVTILTSVDEPTMNRDLHISGGVEEEVVALAELAASAGLDGVVASPREVRAIRRVLPRRMVVVTPGVRPAWAQADDQKRTMTPGDAIAAGASYVVIGRPITQPPAEIGTPTEAARFVAEEISLSLEVDSPT
jgi:orotidine-5'-phosphate decarboxylase